ncbi:unnamed protein product [Dibothriocephalus latus]|uniref:Aquaporin n=1 Tax=Dibothriocephalus latus TaxID=60516 RepID=A0A3P6S2T4_DIBLA|nr:unnamed protein product [Dibothriocephalus latus]
MAFGIYTMIEGRLPIVPAGISPALLGMVVFLALSAYTGAGGAPLNPARDFGPRLMCLSTCKSYLPLSYDNNSLLHVAVARLSLCSLNSANIRSNFFFFVEFRQYKVKCKSVNNRSLCSWS